MDKTRLTTIRVTAKAGQRITLWHGETLDENGNFTQSNFDPGERNKNGGIPQKLEYICKDGENVYKPRFAIITSPRRCLQKSRISSKNPRMRSALPPSLKTRKKPIDIAARKMVK